MPAIIAAWAWLLAPAVAAVSAAPAVPELNLVELAGQIQIQTQYELLGLAAGVPLPLSIEPGSEVSVLSGKAVLEFGDLTVRASGADSFAFSLIKNGDSYGIRLAATNSPKGILLEIGDATTLLNGDCSVAVVPAAGGLEVQSQAGYVTLSMLDRDEVLAPGQVARVDMPLFPEKSSGEPAMVSREPLVEPGEELRSAVASKRDDGAAAEPASRSLTRNSLGAVAPLNPVREEPPSPPPLRMSPFYPDNCPACWAIDPRVGPTPENVCGSR